MSNYPDPKYSQPGLEVAHSNYPEVVHLPEENYPIPVDEPAFVPYKAEASSPYSYSNASYNAIPGPYAGPYGALNVEQGGLKAPARGNGSRKRLFILIGVLAAIAVIVGAVVGGVLGSQASRDGSKAAQTTGTSSSPSESTSPPSASSSASPQVNTTAVRPNTRLSVTGRRLAGDGFTSRLFWQGGDNKIRTSRYSSAGGGAWTAPLVFDGTADARPGTPIAATIYLVFPQFEVFYLDAASSTFRGINFGEDETVPKVDSVDTDRPAFSVGEGSRMAAYWPYIIYQNADATFHREVYDSRGDGWFNDTMQGWFDTTVVPYGDSGTGMAVVPVVKAYQGPYAAGIAFRGRDGRLAIFSFGGDDTGISWHSGTPNVAIPAGTSIGAFAVGRANSNTTNTYILYQDASHMIQAVWQEDGGAWKGPQQVGAADAGTDIACLTEVVSDLPSQVSLSEQPDMRRCYYQSGGRIVEKRLASSGWVDGDAIPME
ncbi:hypothetical protein F4820DRAFT_128611 [Hypoxylon rubiginosum]|uniref:Uncharacterized protein n=1 Tax=Hypoxylon rubiginosum TaxID=110542 RepID=A0ACB9YKV0_9PEZI|nr:hypothetical protein F4820DRAFT_128611 [Hypoxylon rubiginosum]